MKVRELMIKEVISIDLEASVKDAANLMAQKGIGSLVVTKERKPVGIITERDLLSRVMATGKNAEATMVKAIMSKPLICGNPEMNADEAARFMANKKIKKLPIVEDGQLIGMMTLTDLCTVQPDLSKVIEEETRGKIPKRFIKRLSKKYFRT
ncbi:MAG: CBS domain-containing protein [Candidatus Bathyarchaeota archaeon]|nr:MAG: CBS domain-containing protein [Candidatus Bathyarchaeota archaeon]